MANPMPDFTEETMKNHQEFRMSWLTVSLRSIACISKMKKKKKRKKENDGRKLQSVSPESSVFHCSRFLLSFDSWKIKFFVCFYKTKCTPFSSLLFPPVCSVF